MYTSIYSDETPLFISQLANTFDMKRLRDIGMHCGVEYASFPIYQHQKMPYSRLTHSIGVSLIIWNFTHDIRQAIAGLLHDIATPTFAHTIDFLNGDHLVQESTEDMTLHIIKSSKEITNLLNLHHIRVEDVADYHIYPIADNDTPMLSADRLEYTLGNGFCVYNMEIKYLNDIYADITIAKNENGTDELCFRSVIKARQFADISLRNSYLFVSDEDRFAMQYLADIMRFAIDNRVLTPNDFYLSETDVIEKLKSDMKVREMWENYIRISSVASSNEKPTDTYSVKVSAKKRFIDPLVLVNKNVKRLSDIDDIYSEKIRLFNDSDFSKWIYAV